ncbi:hypothetical protein ACGFMK_20320 [Amycolatopsis sp. NPDC049252]|uniref:hypothetical protein n=1 Tax=Amycolatopsis sp. NPDC049252 TaxID=3363933 RepID=UPI003724ACCC
MPKDSHSARRQDAKLLGLLVDIPHSEAVKRLAGDRGPEPAGQARRVVEDFHQAARAHTAATGQSVRSAKDDLLRERGLLPADAAFPILHASTYDWSEMHGLHTRCERRTADVTQSLTGVLLPPVPGQPAHRLRAVLTAPVRGREPGDVVFLDARRWQFDSNVPQADASTPRRTRCTAGRPVYTELTLPADILLPLPALRRRRLIPARTQAPVATLRANSGRHSPLYAVADAVPIPAETPRQARALQRIRTCGTCDIASDEPFRMARDGQRYCETHFDAAVERVKRGGRARGRAVSAVWARDVLGDPATLMLALLGADNDKIILHAESLAGEVVFDHVLCLADVPDKTDVLLGQVRLDLLPPWVNDTAIQTVFGRRLLTAVTEGADSAFVSLLNAARDSRQRHFSVRSEWRDQVWRRYEIWQGKRRPEPARFELRRAFFEPQYLDAPVGRRRGPQVEYDAATVLASMRAMLAEMAADDLTQAEIAHAERYLADEPRPGASPFDRRSDRAKLPASLMQVFGDKDVPSA